MCVFKYFLFILLIGCIAAYRKRHAHRCFEEVDLEKCGMLFILYFRIYFNIIQYLIMDWIQIYIDFAFKGP